MSWLTDRAPLFEQALKDAAAGDVERRFFAKLDAAERWATVQTALLRAPHPAGMRTCGLQNGLPP
jgi:hypothetical protein